MRVRRLGHSPRRIHGEAGAIFGTARKRRYSLFYRCEKGKKWETLTLLRRTDVGNFGLGRKD